MIKMYPKFNSRLGVSYPLFIGKLTPSITANVIEHAVTLSIYLQY